MIAQRKELNARARALHQQAEEEERSFTVEESRQFDDLMATVADLTERIERERSLRFVEEDMSRSHRPAQRPQLEDAAPTAQRFRSLGEQLQAVMRAAQPGLTVDPRLSTRAALGLNEGTPADGGFLVQQDFVSTLLQRTYETSVLAPRCWKLEMTSSANSTSINAIAETSRANGSRWGGIQAYWEDEADQITASKPKFRQMQLNLRRLTGLCYATEEMLQDSNILEEVITRAFAEEFGFKLDDAILSGSGVGQPLGILNSGAVVTQAKETSQAASTILVQNIVKMWSRLFARHRANAVWYINQEIEPQLHLMSLTVGSGGVPVYMPAGGISGQPYATLYGRPVVAIEQASALGTVGDIMVADLGEYALIDKGGIRSASSIHVRFVNDEQAFRFIYRVDGQPLWNAPLTPYKGSSTLSPFVTLATRG